ncbi:MAG: hypothetical protein IT178_11255 [Acidobacteria bacterium]|nr:hypothetical protein [Acidobacteriota bacterium]
MANRRGSTPSPVVVFFATLGALLVVTAGLWLTWPDAGRIKAITRAERPSDDYYLANDHGGHVDHHVIYFGTDSAVTDHLRRADVLLLGNSRLMFAARPRVLDGFFESRGLRYYAMGFGFREMDRFPLAIIEKFDLTPKLVIVNADGFFRDDISDFARTVMKDDAFGAWQLRHEAEAGHEVRRGLHQVVPNFIDLFGRPGFPWRREVVIYRSRTNGTWQLSPWDLGQHPVPPRDIEEPRPGRDEIRAAQRFKDALARRGARLVLTYVPTPRPMGGSPAAIARSLGAPLIAVHPAELKSEDGDHLDEPSAIAWTEAFVRELGALIP